MFGGNRMRALWLLTLCVLAGCQPALAPAAANPSASVLTPDDLAFAQGIRWWIIEVPEAPPGQRLCLAFLDHQGVIESRACPPVKSGDQVKVVLSGLDNWNLRFQLLVGDTAYRGKVTNHFRYLLGPATEAGEWRKHRPGDLLMKQSDSKSVGGTDDPLVAGEVGLALVFQQEPQTSVRQGWWEANEGKRVEAIKRMTEGREWRDPQ